MKRLAFCFIVLSVLLFFSNPLYAQHMTYPYYFGPTSIPHYGPYVMSPAVKFVPSVGNVMGSMVYPTIADMGFLSSVKIHPEVQAYYQMLQYYQYLSYAYNFYQIASMTPYFYMTDIVADYIGSSLYSYIQQTGLPTNTAIINFIQQNLL